MEKHFPDILREAVNKDITAAHQIVGKGSVNTIYIVETPTDKVVTRLNEERGIEEYLKEKWAIQHAIAVGIPTSDVLNIGEKDGTSFMVISFLSGTTGNESTANANHIWEQMGKFAKLLHGIPVVGIGLDIVDPEKNAFGGSWDRYLTYNIASLTEEDQLIELGVLDIESSKRIKAIFENLRLKELNFGLNHGDLSLKNTIIDEDKKVSLIDWGSVEAQVVPHHDFGEVIRSSVKPGSPEFSSFLKGYGMSEEEFKDIEDEVYIILLLRSIDKLRWAIDRSPKDIDYMINLAKPYIDIVLNDGSNAR